jgi:hypothetical protein
MSQGLMPTLSPEAALGWSCLILLVGKTSVMVDFTTLQKVIAPGEPYICSRDT